MLHQCSSPHSQHPLTCKALLQCYVPFSGIAIRLSRLENKTPPIDPTASLACEFGQKINFDVLEERTRPRMSTATRPIADLLALCSHRDKHIREDRSPGGSGAWEAQRVSWEASSTSQHAHIAYPTNETVSFLSCRETSTLKFVL